MKSKLTKQAADELVSCAMLVIEGHPYIRLGQAISNILDKSVAENLVWGETDFYYWSNDALVLETFYRECVED